MDRGRGGRLLISHAGVKRDVRHCAPSQISAQAAPLHSGDPGCCGFQTSCLAAPPLPFAAQTYWPDVTDTISLRLDSSSVTLAKLHFDLRHTGKRAEETGAGLCCGYKIVNDTSTSFPLCGGAEPPPATTSNRLLLTSDLQMDRLDTWLQELDSSNSSCLWFSSIWLGRPAEGTYASCHLVPWPKLKNNNNNNNERN